MKKILYTALICCLMLGFQACEDDYEDASKEYVYGPNENPPVKNNPEATVSAAYDMYADNAEPMVISITPYADIIQKQLGVTIEELISAIERGTIKVCPINSNRNIWDKTPANAGGTYAWHLNNSGNICEAGSEYMFATLSFDPAAKEFGIVLDENAGGTVILSIGFALDGPNYNTHVRFIFTVTAFDKSFVLKDVEIAAGAYSAYELKFADIADNISFAFGMTPEAFSAALDAETGGSLKLYMIDHSTKLFMWDGASTANNGGYWVNSSHEICTWGTTGYSYYIEPWTGTDGSIAIGRAPDPEAGTVFDIKFGVSNVDRTKNLTFYITATLL